jgi:hypothetical protein
MTLPSESPIRSGKATGDHMVYLQVPRRRFIHPHTVLYEPNPLDLWLVANKCDAWHRSASASKAGHLSDVPFDQVLCAIFLDITEVR